MYGYCNTWFFCGWCSNKIRNYFFPLKKNTSKNHGGDLVPLCRPQTTSTKPEGQMNGSDRQMYGCLHPAYRGWVHLTQCLWLLLFTFFSNPGLFQTLVLCSLKGMSIYLWRTVFQTAHYYRNVTLNFITWKSLDPNLPSVESGNFYRRNPGSKIHASWSLAAPRISVSVSLSYEGSCKLAPDISPQK